MLTKKDLIRINQQFSTGNLVNESSLDFVLGQTKRSPHWFKTMCLLTRAILVDHPFEDGNKRTATAVIISYLEMNGYNYNPDKISQLVLRIAKSNLNDIHKIGRLINYAIKTI